MITVGSRAALRTRRKKLEGTGDCPHHPDSGSPGRRNRLSMPITYHIDHEQRMVVARGLGRLTEQEIFTYQREVWSRSDVAGYDELVDMTAVEQVEDPTAFDMRRLARTSAATDGPTDASGKFAILAPQDLFFGLGRMYQAYREMTPGSRKRVGVFRTLDEIKVFLGRAELPGSSGDSESPPPDPRSD